MSDLPIKILRAAVFLLIGFAQLMGARDRNQWATAQGKQTVLQGGVSHSEVLPALPPGQQVGQIFDGFAVPQIEQEASVTQPKSTVLPKPIAPPNPVAPLKPKMQSTKQTTVPPNLFAAKEHAATAARAPLPKILSKAAPPAHNPSSAQIAAAMRAYAGQRNLAGMVQYQSGRAQPAVMQTGIIRAASPQSAKMLNGSATSLQSNANRQRVAIREQGFKIPPWMAGLWQRSDANETSRMMLPSGKKLQAAGHGVASVKEAFGTFHDASGQIWQIFDPRKATGSIDRGANIDYSKVTGYNIVANADGATTVVVRATHAIVSKSTHRIVSSFQDEELNTYSKLPDGRLRTDSSVKIFDAQGKPQLLTKAFSTEVRLAPFSGPLLSATTGSAAPASSRNQSR